METIALTISLPKDVGAALENKARVSGKGAAEYVAEMVARQVRRPALRELFADVRQDITLDDAKLTDEIDAAIAESR